MREVPVVASESVVPEIVTQVAARVGRLFDGDHVLAFDATWLGFITAVAVWDHRPSAVTGEHRQSDA